MYKRGELELQPLGDKNVTSAFDDTTTYPDSRRWGQEGKQGGKCCCCCCDYRRAVIIFSIMALISNAFGLSSLMSGPALPNEGRRLSIQDNNSYLPHERTFDETTGSITVSTGDLDGTDPLLDLDKSFDRSYVPMNSVNRFTEDASNVDDASNMDDDAKVDDGLEEFMEDFMDAFGNLTDDESGGMPTFDDDTIKGIAAFTECMADSPPATMTASYMGIFLNIAANIAALIGALKFNIRLITVKVVEIIGTYWIWGSLSFFP